MSIRVCVDRDGSCSLHHSKHVTSVGDRLGVSRVSGAELRSPICCVLKDNVLFQLAEYSLGVSVVTLWLFCML
jgi:hypothetical protein